MSIAYLNGEFLPLKQITISPLDRGFLFGDGVYEVVPAYGRRPFRLSPHLARLNESLDAIKIRNPRSPAQWEDIVRQLVERQDTDHVLLYLQVTRGVAPREHGFPADVSPTVFAMTKPWSRSPEILPMRAITLADNRWLRCDIKSTALLGNVLLRQEALAAGANECLLIRDGYLTEGAASNVFVVAGSRVLTPPKSHLLLSGITREFVVELLLSDGLGEVEMRVSRELLRDADEIWITSSSMEVRPVVTLDHRRVGTGAPGPVYERVRELFQRHHEVAGVVAGST